MAKNPSAKRYALALYQLARDKGSVEKCQEDLRLCKEILADENISAFLSMPNIHVSQKIDLFKSNLKDVEESVYNLLGILIQRDASALASDILEQYGRLLDEEKGLERAHVVSAIPMSEDNKDSLSKYLSQLVGKDIKLTSEVDSSILAGLVARVGDKILDGSVKTRLQSLRKSLAEST
jgi:F-type H+-transporting ATPase subunit delta